jgi:hypothetical protein
MKDSDSRLETKKIEEAMRLRLHARTGSDFEEKACAPLRNVEDCRRACNARASRHARKFKAMISGVSTRTDRCPRFRQIKDLHKS